MKKTIYDAYTIIDCNHIFFKMNVKRYFFLCLFFLKRFLRL